ncbi:unnamed protein product [Haemonchus placei]|uniref:Secreted protein n=1 Tax=Haemonchus placei TaxID=6290 RepID=A0A158QNB9_HAEPC|nr:unnamed protein product [Haemonchus placei]
MMCRRLQWFRGSDMTLSHHLWCLMRTVLNSIGRSLQVLRDTQSRILCRSLRSIRHRWHRRHLRVLQMLRCWGHMLGFFVMMIIGCGIWYATRCRRGRTTCIMITRENILMMRSAGEHGCRCRTWLRRLIGHGLRWRDIPRRRTRGRSHLIEIELFVVTETRAST